MSRSVFAGLTALLVAAGTVFGVPVTEAASLVEPVTIPAGLRLDEVAELLEREGVADAGEIRARAVDPAFVESLGIPGDSLEGFIQAGTYPFIDGMPAEMVLKALVAPYRQVFGETQRKRAAELGLSELRVITLASLVEKEAADHDQRALVSGVLHNRLERNWHLDSDPTVIHALALSPGGFDGKLSRGDFRSEHPYNTYLQPGLPPGPICSPSADAIRAVLYPRRTDFLVWFGNIGNGRGAHDLEIDPAEREALDGVRADPHPGQTTRGKHYIVSNEMRQYHFRPAIERIGGVFIGVGADQNYTMAGWARPELLVLMDFDQVIADLHSVYRLAFLEADTPAEFLDLWQRGNRKRFRELIKEAYASDRRRRIAALQAFRLSRRAVFVRLTKLMESYSTAGRSFFLTDPEQYAHIRTLYRTGRVLAVRGDLTARRTMHELGQVLADSGRTVRVLYLSNVEQYFPYSRRFRRNIAALPIDEWSLVLRTRPVGQDYTYVLQWYRNFLRWLERPGVRNVRFLVPRSKLSRSRPVFQVVEEPPEPKPRLARKQRRAVQRAR